MSFEVRDVLVPWRDPWDAQTRIDVLGNGDSLIFLRSREATDTSDSVMGTESTPPDVATVFVKPRRNTPQGQIFEALQHLVERIVANAPARVIRLDELTRQVTAARKFPDRFVEGCLRVLAGRGTLVITKAKTKKLVYDVRLSEAAQDRERMRAFGASFAHELQASSEQIGLLIGHNGVVGSFREDLLRALIQRYIPQRYHAATGFIAGVANQLDIIIYDQIDYAPLFRAGDLVVVSGEAVRAIIEVKSALTSAELDDAIRHLLAARPPAFGRPPVFVGIFGYTGAGSGKLIETIRKVHAFDDEGLGDHIADEVDDIITAVCVLRQCVLMPEFLVDTADGGEVVRPAISRIESFSGRESEAAFFFDLLSRFLRHPVATARTDAGRSWLLAGDMFRVAHEWIYPPDAKWQPYIPEDYVDRVTKERAAYERWLDGESWVVERTE